MHGLVEELGAAEPDRGGDRHQRVGAEQRQSQLPAAKRQQQAGKPGRTHPGGGEDEAGGEVVRENAAGQPDAEHQDRHGDQREKQAAADA